MPLIDPSTAIGKIRLRVGDWSDLPLLSDSVIQSALDDCDNNLPRAAKLSAQYILAMLSFKTHRKIAQMEVWSGEQFKNYVQFIQMTILNPNMADIAPIPYNGSEVGNSDIVQFVSDWKKNYYNGTQSQALAFDASNSPNDGSVYGPFGVA